VNFPLPIVWSNKVGFLDFYWDNRSDGDKQKSRADENKMDVKLSNIGAVCMVCGMGFAPGKSKSGRSKVSALKKCRRHLVDDHRCPSRAKVSDATKGKSRLDVGVAIGETLHQNINPDLSGDPELVPMEMLKS
jgi:hypothetical protein